MAGLISAIMVAAVRCLECSKKHFTTWEPNCSLASSMYFPAKGSIIKSERESLTNQRNSLSDLIIDTLAGKYIELAREQFGSHVVKCFFEHSRHRTAAAIIAEIRPAVLSLARDRYGHYIIEVILKRTKSTSRLDFDYFCSSLLRSEDYLAANPHGKQPLFVSSVNRRISTNQRSGSKTTV
ncbi:unnamed protein product [Cochlearia groenlandica]